MARDVGAEPSVIVERHVRHYVVAPNGTYRLTVDDVRTVAGPPAVRDRGRFTIRFPIHYDRSLDELVAVEAYVHKAGGRRIAVPPDGIQDGQDESGGGAGIVAFPDAAPGDRLVVHYVVQRHTAPFPGQFEDLTVLPFLVRGNAMLIYDMPAALPLHADAAGFVPVPGDSPPGRRRYRWRHESGRNDSDTRSEAGAVSILDDGRRLAVSTFPDYPAFASAWRAAFAGKALPSPGIEALARQLTAGLPDTRARVLALAEWVRRNIRPVNDQPGIAPHPADMVLAARRGDARDRAVLLEALLAAAGIAGTPALVNAGNAYRLPDAPTLGVLDHTIVYVPALDLFVDPAAASVPAGDLPPALLGKPVLLLKSGTFAVTPVLQPHTIRTVATVDAAGLWADGSLPTTDRARSAVDAAVANLMQERERRHDFVCAALDVEDDTRLRLPPGLRVTALPEPASVIMGGIFYRASYVLENDGVSVKRRLTFRHGRATCTPLDARAMRPALERIRRDLRSRIAVATHGSNQRSGVRVAGERVAPPHRAQVGHGLVREIETQVDAVAPRAVAAGPARDLDEAAALEKAGRVRMRIDRHVAGPQLTVGHVQQAVGQQDAADARAVAVRAHEAEHERAEVVERGQFVAAEADDLTAVHGDEQRPVRVVQRGTQP